MHHWLVDGFATAGTGTAARLFTTIRTTLAALWQALGTLAGHVWHHEPSAHPVGRRGLRFLAGTVAATMASSVAGFLLLSVPTAAPAATPTQPVALADDPLARLRVRVPDSAPATSDRPADAPPSTLVSDDDEPATETVQVTDVAATRRESAPNLLPTGKGMWFNRLEYTADSPERIIERAREHGLTHLYVRLGSSRSGFHARNDLDRILPLAHQAGLQVVGWEFPYLEDPVADALRAVEEITYTTPGGHRIDAFSADIETQSEGVKLGAEAVEIYSRTLREKVGPGYPLVATVPNACLNKSFPYAEVARYFDAIAPMVYWITRNPATDVACNIDKLAEFGLPVLPIGQAYDPAIDNPTLVDLVPGYDHLAMFMDEAAARGAAGVSFWVWHTATPDMWAAIRDSHDFTLVPMGPGHDAPEQVAVLQRLLTTYGYPVAITGAFDEATTVALKALQSDLGLEPTGALDEATLAAL